MKRVRVKDDATMWGEPGAAPSVYRGLVGELDGCSPQDGYDVTVRFSDRDSGVSFKWHELEAS